MKSEERDYTHTVQVPESLTEAKVFCEELQTVLAHRTEALRSVLDQQRHMEDALRGAQAAATTKHDRMVETQNELRRVAAKATELEAQVGALLERPCKECSRRPTDPDNAVKLVANPAMPGDRVLVTDGIHTASIRVDPEAPFRNVSMEDIAQSVKASMDRWGAVIVGGGGGRGGAGAAGIGGAGAGGGSAFGQAGKGGAVGVGGTPFAQEARATYVATSSPTGPVVRPFATEKPAPEKAPGAESHLDKCIHCGANRGEVTEYPQHHPCNALGTPHTFAPDLHQKMREIVAAPLPIEQPESLRADVRARVQRYIDTLRALPEAERDAELRRIPHELLPGVSYLLRTMPTRKAEDGK